MALIFFNAGSSGGKTEAWIGELERRLPELEVRLWPEVGDEAEIAYALVWQAPPGFFTRFPNLELILSLGAGVEAILADPEVPDGVPVVRLVDRLLTSQMVEYVTLAVLRHHRQALDYAASQAERSWRPLPPRDTERTTVGILGLGVIGAAAARALAGLGFRVAGWSRGPKEIPGVVSYHGAAGLDALLRESAILVCLLPLTPETEGIINARALALLPDGAAVVNAGRGGHVVEEDLLAALASGHVAEATLDAFREEPLPPDHPYWKHPKVVITPHVAAETIPGSAAASVAESIRRFEAGEPLPDVVDRARGY